MFLRVFFDICIMNISYGFKTELFAILLVVRRETSDKT